MNSFAVYQKLTQQCKSTVFQKKMFHQKTVSTNK